MNLFSCTTNAPHFLDMAPACLINPIGSWWESEIALILMHLHHSPLDPASLPLCFHVIPKCCHVSQCCHVPQCTSHHNLGPCGSIWPDLVQKCLKTISSIPLYKQLCSFQHYSFLYFVGVGRVENICKEYMWGFSKATRLMYIFCSCQKIGVPNQILW